LKPGDLVFFNTSAAHSAMSASTSAKASSSIPQARHRGAWKT
jgi:ectoine hydroxylase-related dioxygenase (phytanoyl-CoA dioxygenase family)